MKTLYFQTNQYVRREGNVIDFTEYRSRLQRSAAAPAAVGDDVSYHWETDESIWHYEEPKPQPRAPRRRRIRLNLSLADVLELCTAGATLALVITVWIQFLF